MKKILFSAMALGGLMAMTSCSSEEPVNAGGDGVNFTIQLPKEIGTRALYGDGTGLTLNNLKYTVYQVDGATLTQVGVDQVKPNAFAGSQTVENVEINLAKGKKYQVVFYADDANNDFATFEAGDVKVDYTKAASNVAGEDVFVGASNIFTVDNGYTETVTLTRPFAQLNWGTDDKDLVEDMPELNVIVKSGLYTSYNVLSKEVAEAYEDEVNFGAVAAPAAGFDFPVAHATDGKKYDLLAMNYLLTGNGTIDCELKIGNLNEKVEVNNAPVNINYRTNIYGSLLTNPAIFNIIVDKDFYTPDNNIDYEAVEVSTQAALKDAVAAGTPVKLMSDNLQFPLNGIAAYPATDIDLNGHTLYLNGAVPVTDNVTLRNGTLKCNKLGNNAQFTTGADMTLILTDVEFESFDSDDLVMGALVRISAKDGEKGAVRLNNVTAIMNNQNTLGVGVASTATNPEFTVEINNSTIQAYAPLQVQGAVNLRAANSTFSGCYFGAYLQTGDYDFYSCEFTTRFNSEWQGCLNIYNNKENTVATNAVINNCKFNANGAGQYGILTYQQAGGGKVTCTLSGNNTVTGGKGSLLGNAGATIIK